MLLDIRSENIHGYRGLHVTAQLCSDSIVKMAVIDQNQIHVKKEKQTFSPLCCDICRDKKNLVSVVNYLARP